MTINGKGVTVPLDGRVVYDFTTPGTYTLVATVKDMASNIGTVTRTIEIAANTDFTAPSVNIASPAAGSYHSGIVNLHATIADNTDGYISWTVRVTRPNGTMGRSYTGDGPVVDLKISETAYLGEYTIEIEAVDAAGNVSITTRSYFQDTVAPKCVTTNFADISRTALGWITNPFSLAATFTDANSPDELITWTVTAENYTTGEKFTVATGTGGDVNVGIDPSAHTSGRYRFTITATDAAGNSSNRVFDTSMDGHPPTLEVIGVEKTGYKVRFNLLCGDDFHFSYNVIEYVSTPAGPSGFKGTSSADYTGALLQDGYGTYVFKIWGVDAAGNESVPQTIIVHHSEYQ